MRTAAQGERSGVGPYIGCQTAVKRCRAYADSGAGRWRRRAERAARDLRSGVRMSDFKLSPKNQAGVFVGFATLKGIYGSVLMVGEGKYVVAREHVNYVQDHFPLQKEKSANPELDWLHRLLDGRMILNWLRPSRSKVVLVEVLIVRRKGRRKWRLILHF